MSALAAAVNAPFEWMHQNILEALSDLSSESWLLIPVRLNAWVIRMRYLEPTATL